jgi:hypothetical protein
VNGSHRSTAGLAPPLAGGHPAVRAVARRRRLPARSRTANEANVCTLWNVVCLTSPACGVTTPRARARGASRRLTSIAATAGTAGPVLCSASSSARVTRSPHGEDVRAHRDGSVTSPPGAHQLGRQALDVASPCPGTVRELRAPGTRRHGTRRTEPAAPPDGGGAGPDHAVPVGVPPLLGTDRCARRWRGPSSDVQRLDSAVPPTAGTAPPEGVCRSVEGHGASVACVVAGYSTTSGGTAIGYGPVMTGGVLLTSPASLRWFSR